MTNDNENKRQTRSLIISNFRNIAPYATSDGKGKETLKINRGLSRNELGGLVILIGGNNCGKSNVLAAVQKFKKKKIDVEDYTDFADDPVTPKLEMKICDGGGSNNSENETTAHVETLSDVVRKILLEDESHESYNKLFNNKVPRATYNMLMSDFFVDVFDKNDMGTKGLIVNVMRGRKDAREIKKITDAFEKMDVRMSDITPYDDSQRTNKTTAKTNADSLFKQTYGYEINDDVYVYSREKIKMDDFTCSPDDINPFFEKILSCTTWTPEKIENTVNGSNWNTLKKKINREINSELKTIEKRFNSVFSDQDKKYTMEIELHHDSLAFSLSCGDDIGLNIDRQSEGFKWIFEFFFNLIISTKFKPGDMVLMDEFGNSLNFGTVADLGKELRKFAKDKGVTFILATQNPMVIDTGHLDEVRLVVAHEDGSSSILNDFTEFNDYSKGINKYDLLKPLLNGMTVGRNYMRTENRRTIFVEGAREYFYLTSFTRMMSLGEKSIDLDYLPVNGLGASDGNPSDLMKTLISMERYEPTMLIDSDKLGGDITDMAKEFGVTLIQVKNVFPDGTKNSIEDLFHADDLKKYGLDKRLFDVSACFSHNIDQYYPSLNPETKENFERLIEHIRDSGKHAM